MSKIMWIILLFFAGAANAVAQVKDCHVGADPWFPGRQIDRNTEVEYVLTKPLVVESLNGQGKPSGLCRLLPGEHIVVPFGFDTSVRHPFATREEKMMLAWVKRCGNPIVSTFHFVVPQKAEATAVVPQEVEPVAQAPQVEKKDFYDTAKFPDVVPSPTSTEEEPPETRVVRYVVVAPRVQRSYGGSYGYETPTFVPQPQSVRSDYYTSPNIRYPDPTPFVPQPQVIVGGTTVSPPSGHAGGGGSTVSPPGGRAGL